MYNKKYKDDDKLKEVEVKMEEKRREEIRRRLREVFEERVRAREKGKEKEEEKVVGKKEVKEELSISEKVLKAIKKYKRLFLEQGVGTVADLGEIPREPVRDKEDLVGGVDKETVGKDIEALLDEIQGQLPDGIEVRKEGEDGFVVESDEATVVVRLRVDGGEPQIVVTADDMEGKVTVSLTPLIGVVSDEGEMVERILNDEEVKGEVIEFVIDLVVTGASETEVSLEAPEFEEVVEGEPREEEGESGVEVDVEEEEREVEERFKKRAREKEISEQDESGDDILRKVMDRFSWKIEYKEEPTPGEVVGAGSGLTKGVMKQLDPGKKISPAKELTQPDIIGFLRGEEAEDKQRISQ